jgi:hypothetical protein
LAVASPVEFFCRAFNASIVDWSRVLAVSNSDLIVDSEAGRSLGAGVLAAGFGAGGGGSSEAHPIMMTRPNAIADAAGAAVERGIT